MNTTHTAIYRANVRSPYGHFIFAVDSTAQDARSDVVSAALAEFGCHIGMLRIDEPVKSNRRLVADMWPVKKCTTATEQWAWFIR